MARRMKYGRRKPDREVDLGSADIKATIQSAVSGAVSKALFQLPKISKDEDRSISRTAATDSETEKTDVGSDDDFDVPKKRYGGSYAGCKGKCPSTLTVS